MKNVLFIVYYFPPMGGSGVQRPLKFVKYLREFGWNPIVLCPEPGLYPYFDESLQEELEGISVEIIRIDPNTLFHIGSSSSSHKKEKIVPDSLARIARRFLRLFLYPDNKRGWINPAVKKGIEVLNQMNIEAIFSTAPPFSNHIIGKQLSDKTGLPLVLDYRDAWLHNHFMDGMFSWQKRIMRKLESGCIQKADKVIGLDEFMIHKMESEYEGMAGKGEVIAHGFDPEDFEKQIQPTLEYRDGKLNLLYSGLFYESNQPDRFLSALVLADSEGLLNLDDLHLHFQGGLDVRIKQLIRKLNLEHLVSDYGYVDHETAVANLKRADVLWMISNFEKSHKQIKSGKLFEYFGSAKPVIGLVNEGVEAELLRNYGAGFVADMNSKEKIAVQLGILFKKWKKDELLQSDKAFIEQFNRRKLTQKLAQIFDKISSQ